LQKNTKQIHNNDDSIVAKKYSVKTYKRWKTELEFCGRLLVLL